jgi:hypothetical protein
MTREQTMRGAVAVTTVCLMLTSAGEAWAQKAESPRPPAPPASGSPPGPASPPAPKAERSQAPAEPDIAAQKKAMSAWDFMDGVWEGPAWTLLPTGTRLELTQTERIGPMLDGLTKVVEGRGYGKDGKTQFNAMAVLSYDERSGRYEMRSYAQGRVGTFEIKLKAPGVYQWEIPAGPAVIRYTTTVKDGVWHEVGEHVAPGRPPVRFFEMKLKRVGDTDWPLGQPVKPTTAGR